MSLRRRALTILLVLVAGFTSAPARAATPGWAPFDQATIHPGVQTITGGQSQCTTNFVFHDGSDVYIGQAAHCSMTGASLTEADPLAQLGPNGCRAESLPLGSEIAVEGATRPGKLVYNSWITMQEVGETDPSVCSANDFALILLDPADRGRVNPTMPFWGGPTGLAAATQPGDKVLSYGNSELRLGLSALSPKLGVSRGQSPDGWSHTVVTVTPGIPGDSGSGFIDAQGRAFGVLSTLIVLPQPANNGVGDLTRQIAYMWAYSDLDDVVLATGTEPFDAASPLDPALPLLSPILDLAELPLRLLADLLGGLPLP